MCYLCMCLAVYMYMCVNLYIHIYIHVCTWEEKKACVHVVTLLCMTESHGFFHWKRVVWWVMRSSCTMILAHWRHRFITMHMYVQVYLHAHAHYIHTPCMHDINSMYVLMLPCAGPRPTSSYIQRRLRQVCCGEKRARVESPERVRGAAGCTHV